MATLLTHGVEATEAIREDLLQDLVSLGLLQ